MDRRHVPALEDSCSALHGVCAISRKGHHLPHQGPLSQRQSPACHGQPRHQPAELLPPEPHILLLLPGEERLEGVDPGCRISKRVLYELRVLLSCPRGRSCRHSLEHEPLLRHQQHGFGPLWADHLVGRDSQRYGRCQRYFKICSDVLNLQPHPTVLRLLSRLTYLPVFSSAIPPLVRI